MMKVPFDAKKVVAQSRACGERHTIAQAIPHTGANPLRHVIYCPCKVMLQNVSFYVKLVFH